MDEIEAFEKEFRDLLIKYNASITFNCSDCVDIHDHVIIKINNKTVIELNKLYINII